MRVETVNSFGSLETVERAEPRCADCDHLRFEHRPETSLIEMPTASGGFCGPYYYGRCGHIDRSMYHTGRPCSCPAYRPDDFPLVTDLIGFDARREIERLLDVVPVRRPRDPFEYREGDLVVVQFGTVVQKYVVRHVEDGRYTLEPVE